MKKMKKYIGPAFLLAVFEAIAITLWLTKNNLFYLLNFSYIGFSVALGVFLFQGGYRRARRVDGRPAVSDHGDTAGEGIGFSGIQAQQEFPRIKRLFCAGNCGGLLFPRTGRGKGGVVALGRGGQGSFKAEFHARLL